MRKAVLLVESEPGVRALLRIQLRLLGLTVIEAGSGRQGVAAFAARGGEVAAIISGELGPPVDGGDLLEIVRAMNPEVPVFFLLGHSLPHSVLCQPGVEVFLKPDGVGELCAAVGDLVAGALSGV